MSKIVDMCKRERELTKDFILHIDKWDSLKNFYRIIIAKFLIC